jgi:hypothetical protein
MRLSRYPQMASFTISRASSMVSWAHGEFASRFMRAREEMVLGVRFLDASKSR